MGETANKTALLPCVLVVEDEILVRMFAVDVLEEAGFEVIQAGSGAEALQALAERKADLSAVIIDLGLPDRRGDEIAAEIRAQCPTLPIIIASGRSERELVDQFASDKAVAILPKPYTEPLMLEVFGRLGVRSVQ
ncbi:response regulator [Povalibacter sp.]|uniref:response regulator n=1 Tax=Povalibacter sp. TaxID=1962978 RepID=UPI002F4177D8